MRQQISKKIFLYFSLFILLRTINNKFFNDFNLPKIKNKNISGLDKNETIDFLKKLDSLKVENLLFLDKKNVDKKIYSNDLIEKYSVFKIYPSSLEIRLKKTKFLANIIKNDKNYFIGSNGKLIESNGAVNELPFIFGEYKNKNFFKLRNDIKESLLDYNEIKNLFIFPSGRWDIETGSGILIELPKEKQKESLNLFYELINSDEFDNTKIIDLRQFNQVIINE